MAVYKFLQMCENFLWDARFWSDGRFFSFDSTAFWSLQSRPGPEKTQKTFLCVYVCVFKQNSQQHYNVIWGFYYYCSFICFYFIVIAILLYPKLHTFVNENFKFNVCFGGSSLWHSASVLVFSTTPGFVDD